MDRDNRGTNGTGLPGVLLAALLGFFAAQNSPADPTSEYLADVHEDIELAYRAGNLTAIESARVALLETNRSAYLAAYARFRQALAAEADTAAARRYVGDCIGELQSLVAREPANAEARALLGSCFGISTRYHRLGLASRGIEARRQMAAARELAPQNPWVMLQDGLADDATPRLFGGDRQLAIRKLEGAARLFEAAAAEGSRMAAWGAAEAWSQLDRIYRADGRTADAALAARRARELLPAIAAGGQQLAAAF